VCFYLQSHVFWYTVTNVSEELAASSFRLEIYEYVGREKKWQGCRVREWEADAAATRRHMPEGMESSQSPS
jgi:hypothetical protein